MKRRSFQQADHIRLKLQWLDEHLQSERPSLAEKVFSATPVLPISISFIIGIVLSDLIFPSQSAFFAVYIIAVLLGVLLIASFFVSGRRRLYTASLATICLFLCLGLMRSWLIQYHPPDHIGRLVGQDRVLATIRGQVVSPVRHHDLRPSFSAIPWLRSKSSFYLAADEVHTAGGWQKISGKVRVQVTGKADHVHPGNDVEVICWLSRFSPPMNPGQFDIARHMRRRGVDISASVGLAEGVEVLQSDHSLLFRLRTFFYCYAADSLLDETLTDPDARSVSAALLLGDRSTLSPAITAAFRKTGLAHFISLSGMHVGILAGSMWLLLKYAQLAKRPRAFVCIALILIYALIVPPRAATMRAVFLSCFFFSSTLFAQKVNPLNTLSLSAVVLLFSRPYDLFSAGWQLSFLSVLGIIVLYPGIHYALQNAIFFPTVLRLKERLIRGQHFLYRLTELLAVGFSAWLTISPVMLLYFGQINPLSPVWTVLVLPLITIILYAGFLKIVLVSVLPTLGNLLGLVLYLSAKLLTALVTLLAKMDLFLLHARQPNLIVVLVMYILLLALCLASYRRRRLRKVCMLVLAFCYFLPALWGFFRQGSHALEMTCLSVGHGQAVVVSTPDCKHLLFDAGSITHQNPAQSAICPYLKNRGIFELDAVCLSHGDLDHINAVPYLAASVPIRRCFANSVLIENSMRPSLEKEFSEAIDRHSLILQPVRDFAGKDYHIDHLWPNPETAFDPAMSDNDRSQVIVIEYAGRRILLCGDIEHSSQVAFLEKYPALHVDVMVLPHHGSTNNLDTRFIEQLSPSIVIASCSVRNEPRAYHPSADTGIEAFYTAIDGAVMVKIKADGTLIADGFLESNK